MKIEADLHIHTTASDGELSPVEILDAAEKASLKGISITDHDSIESVKKAAAAGKNRGLFKVGGRRLRSIHLPAGVLAEGRRDRRPGALHAAARSAGGVFGQA